MARGKVEAQPVLKGILADPEAAKAFRDSMVQRLAPEAARLEALVKSRTPVSDQRSARSKTNPPTGALREGVEARVTATKKGIAVIVRGDKAKRKGTPGDPPRRRGKVPYGVFVDNETDFLTGTVEAEQGRTLKAMNDAIGAWCEEQNAGSGASPSERLP